MRRGPTVILGANGQLGSDLCQAFDSPDRDVVTLTRRDLDVRDHEPVAETLSRLRPGAVINTTAFHKVEACEEDPDTAFAVNRHAVRNLALVCDGLGARLAHISTDYVFAGDQSDPYPEDAAVGPRNVYGASKACGELFVRSLAERHLVIRTSGLFGLAGASGKGGNFVETMLRLGRERGNVSVVTDQVFSPTFTQDLAEKIQQLLEADAHGVFHVTNAGSCSWHEFACAIFELAQQRVDVQPTTAAAMGSTVLRPAYSVLDNRRLREEGFGAIRPWRDALEEYLSRRRDRMDVAA